jgi:hypothetical protein
MFKSSEIKRNYIEETVKSLRLKYRDSTKRSHLPPMKEKWIRISSGVVKRVRS